MPKRNIIVIGASAGGVDALCQLVKGLPKELDATVFVVMHVGAESILPGILNRCGTLKAIPAENDSKYGRGRIYIAPFNYHLMIKDSMTVLSRGPRANGDRPAIDVLFRSAAREHRNRVTGVVLTGGLDDGTAGLYNIKARGGVAVVQDPAEAVNPSMPRSALENVDVDFCLPVSQIPDVLVRLASGEAMNVTDAENGESIMDKSATVQEPTSEPPGRQVPIACPECNGPIYEVKEGELTYFQCFVGHSFSPESLSDEHTDALERALWTAMRKLKERTALHQKLIERRRSKGEEELMRRLEESVQTAEKDLKLLREILERI